MTSFVFVTGGVVSSVGKGVCVGSIGKILKNRGLSVSDSDVILDVSCFGACDDCIPGCMDPNADNYDPNATVDDGTCEYPELGDLNNDNLVNVLDIIICINIIFLAPFQKSIVIIQ